MVSALFVIASSSAVTATMFVTNAVAADISTMQSTSYWSRERWSIVAFVKPSNMYGHCVKLSQTAIRLPHKLFNCHYILMCVIKTFNMKNLRCLAAVPNSHPNINRVKKKKKIIINTAILQVFSTFIKVARYGTHSVRALVHICSFRFPVIDSRACNELEPPCLSLDWTPRLVMVYIFSVCCIVWYQNQRSYSKFQCHFKNNMRP